MISKFNKSSAQFLRINYEHIDALDVDNYIELGVFHINYDSIVSAIITKKYPSDKMQAVINNYLLDPEDEEIKSEYQEMQAWRRFAKDKAKEVLAYAEANGIIAPKAETNEEETN